MDGMKFFRHISLWFRFGVAGAIASVFTLGLETLLGLHLGLPISSILNWEIGSLAIIVAGSIIHYTLAVAFKVVPRE